MHAAEEKLNPELITLALVDLSSLGCCADFCRSKKEQDY